MTAKEELSQLKYKRKKVDETLEEYQKYKTRAEKMTSVISDSPSMTNITSDKVGDNASIMADLAKEYEQRWIAAERERLEIEDKINLVEEPYRTILHMRYIEGSNFEKIAENMGYSYVRITHMHGEALEKYSMMTTLDKT